MKDDWTTDEYLEVKPILLYVKRKEPKEYYPIFIKRKDEEFIIDYSHGF